MLTFRSQNITEETLADIKELRSLLQLDPDATQLRVAFGATATDDKELALQTRSMLHIMTTMAAQADVPAEDVIEGRTPPSFSTTAPDAEAMRLIHIRCSKSKPTDAYVAVAYRNH